MKIKLIDEVKQVSGVDAEFLANRNDAQRVFQSVIKEKLSCYSEVNRKVVVDCQGITTASSSFIDELFFVEIFSLNYHYGNSILLLENLKGELYFNFHMAVEGKKGLIEKAKKEKKYFLTKPMYEEYKMNHPEEDLSAVQIGSPYLLCEYSGNLGVLGFAEGEKQKILLDDMITNGKRYTTGTLAREDDISNTAAANRLSRLYEKNLVFRQVIPGSVPETYEYFYC